MRKLQLSAFSLLFIFLLFIVLNAVEIGYWFFQESNNLSFGIDFYHLKIRQFHTVINLLLFPVALLNLIFLNNYLYRKFEVVKIKIWVLIVSILPLINYVMYYLILRRLNNTLYRQVNRNPKKSNTLLISTMISVVGFIVGYIFLAFFVAFFGKKLGISMHNFSRLSNPILSSLNLCVSVLMTIYFSTLYSALKSSSEKAKINSINDTLLD